MNMEIDTETGGDELTLDEAAAAYAKATTTEEAPQSQSEADVQDEGDTTDDELQEGDEPEGEEADGEDEPDGQAEDDEDDAEPETERGRYVAHNGRVKLPDGTESTVSDLIAGNLMDRDYRQKTMALAEDKKSFEAQSTALKESQEQVEKQREFMSSLLKAIVPAAPDASMTDPRSPNFDPVGFNHQQALHNQWMGYLNQLDQDQQRAVQERQAKAADSESETLKREYDALVGRVPELKDQKRLDRFVTEMREHAPHYGLKPEELKAVALDHRYALILRDAIRFRKIEASKPTVQKKVEGRPPVTKGGKRLNPSEHQARRSSDAMNRLKQTGRIDDAVAALLATSKG